MKLKNIILDDDEVRRLARLGVLVPLDHAPRIPVDEDVMDQLRARMRPHGLPEKHEYRSCLPNECKKCRERYERNERDRRDVEGDDADG